MIKFFQRNRLLSIVILLGVAAVIYLYATPTTPTSTTHKTTVTTTSTKAGEVDAAADYSVHFSRYAGTSHDPFIPGVARDDASSGGPGSLIKGQKWVLTGINAIDGVTSAVVEDTASNQSEFLQVGDSWGGLRVISISDDAINFVNKLGQVTQMGFPIPVTPNGTNNSTIGTNTPSLNQINPLPALNPGGFGQTNNGFRRFGNAPSN